MKNLCTVALRHCGSVQGFLICRLLSPKCGICQNYYFRGCSHAEIPISENSFVLLIGKIFSTLAGWHWKCERMKWSIKSTFDSLDFPIHEWISAMTQGTKVTRSVPNTLKEKKGNCTSARRLTILEVARWHEKEENRKLGNETERKNTQSGSPVKIMGCSYCPVNNQQNSECIVVVWVGTRTFRFQNTRSPEQQRKEREHNPSTKLKIPPSNFQQKKKIHEVRTGQPRLLEIVELSQMSDWALPGEWQSDRHR